MLGVDATRAFDLGQILPHSLWLSCQHLPRPRAAGSDRHRRKSAPQPSFQADLPSAPNPNLLDPQAHVPPTGGAGRGGRAQTASLLCQKPVVTLFYSLCVCVFMSLFKTEISYFLLLDSIK